eukprot:4220868-Amphidinium_carterae.2
MDYSSCLRSRGGSSVRLIQVGARSTVFKQFRRGRGWAHVEGERLEPHKLTFNTSRKKYCKATEPELTSVPPQGRQPPNSAALITSTSNAALNKHSLYPTLLSPPALQLAARQNARPIF